MPQKYTGSKKVPQKYNDSKKVPQKYTDSKKASQKYTGSKGKRESAVQVHWKGKASNFMKYSPSERVKKNILLFRCSVVEKGFDILMICSNVLSLQLSGTSSKLS